MRPTHHPSNPWLISPFILEFVLSPAFLKHNTKCVAYAKALHINEKYIRPHKKHIQLQQKKEEERNWWHEVLFYIWKSSFLFISMSVHNWKCWWSGCVSSAPFFVLLQELSFECCTLLSFVWMCLCVMMRVYLKWKILWLCSAVRSIVLVEIWAF